MVAVMSPKTPKGEEENEDSTQAAVVLPQIREPDYRFTKLTAAGTLKNGLRDEVLRCWPADSGYIRTDRCVYPGSRFR